MRVKILHGSELGQVQEFPEGDNDAQWMLDTGYAELAPEPEPDVDLADLTANELEALGDERGIEAKDIEGTGTRGRVLKADWLRVLE